MKWTAVKWTAVKWSTDTDINTIQADIMDVNVSLHSFEDLQFDL